MSVIRYKDTAGREQALPFVAASPRAAECCLRAMLGDGATAVRVFCADPIERPYWLVAVKAFKDPVELEGE